MTKPVTLYNGSSGLNTVLDPQRLSQGSKDNPGIIELAHAVNVSIDERGLCSLRAGSVEEQSGSFHSLFCDGGDCFVIQERISDAAIMRVNSDYSLTEIRSGLTKDNPMSWGQVNTDTFYSNGIQNGYIRDGVSGAWPSGIARGPNAALMQFESSSPVANHIAFRPGGQLILAVGSEAYINHEPFQYGLFSKRSGYIQFESDITMLKGTTAGFFASDGRRTWFFRKSPEGWFKFKQELVDDASVITGTLATNSVDLMDIGLDRPGFGYIWMSRKGVCVGTEEGIVINLTKNKVKLPTTLSMGAGLVRDNTAILTTYL